MPTTIKPDSLTEVLIELLRSSVMNQEPQISQDVIIDWDKLMDVSVNQSILALVWDGICKLPNKLQPPRQQRINWALSAQETWNEYQQKKNALEYIIDVCNNNGIKLLLLKGIDLSLLYPKPESRSAGDIDIYLFDDYAKGNALFSQGLISEIGKHSTIQVKGVTIENHRNFLEPNTRQKREIVNYLKDTLTDVRLKQGGYYVMSPIPNMVFITFHTLKHFFGGTHVPLRNILDFSLFLMGNKECLPPQECRNVLEKLQLLEGFEWLVCLSEWILGKKIIDYHFVTLPPDYLTQMKEILFAGHMAHGVGRHEKHILKLTSRYIPINIPWSMKTFLIHLLRCIFRVPDNHSLKRYLALQRNIKDD